VISSSNPTKFRQIWPSFVDRFLGTFFSSSGQRSRACRSVHARARKSADWSNQLIARCCCFRATITITKTIAVQKIFLFARDVSRIANNDDVHAMLWLEAGAHDVDNGSGASCVRA
jgi:hypothetical protein